MQIARVALLAAFVAGCQAELQTQSPASTAHWADDTEAAWSAMTTRLDGQWRSTIGEQRTIDVSYRVVSRGSTLVETFTSASGNETLSAYHRDGNALMLTHYCAQGNQARLKATEVGRDSIVFRFLDATNVKADQGVMQQLTFRFRPDGFDQESVYREPNGQPETTTLHFFRKAAPVATVVQ